MAFINTAPMRQARHKALEEARAIRDKAVDEKGKDRPMTGEEQTAFDKAWKDAEEQRNLIDDAERRNALEAELAREALDKAEAEKRASKDKGTETTVLTRTWEKPNYRSLYQKWLRVGTTGLNAEEQRDLSAGTGTQGGYLYAPELFVNELIQNVTDAVIFRQLARVFPPLAGNDSLGAPVLTDRAADAEWTSELGAASRDSTLAFGKRSLQPHPLAKEVVVSKVLLRKTAAAEGIVRSELTRVIAEAMENAYMTGTGNQRPLGVFTASADGINTDRDVSTSNTSTSPTFDGLKHAKYTLKQAYWAGAQWVMHRECMEAIAILKDGNGRYLLVDSVVEGEPDRMLGFPVRLSEFAPHVFTASQYVALLGDFSNYWIVDSMDVEIQRLEELYARNNKDLFIARMASDGAPVRSEAFVRVKLGS